MLKLNVLCLGSSLVNIMLMGMSEKNGIFRAFNIPIDVNLFYLDRGKLSVWLSRLHAELCFFYHIHLPVSKNFSQNSLN